MSTLPELQIKYNESQQFLQARKKRQSAQLVLLSNLRRGDQNISSTLLFTLFSRDMASIYDDKMQVKFLPSQGITQDQINSYNTLAQSDYQEMDKAKHDYAWTWDSMFFGRGYSETLRFDMDKKIMQPSVINPLTFGYDPYNSKVENWRYYWKWVTKNKAELDRLYKAGATKVPTSEIASGMETYIWDYTIRRDQAREGVVPPIEAAQRDVFQILEIYCYDDNGDKHVYWVDKLFSKIIYEAKLDLGDGDDIVLPDGKTVETGSRWPIVMKEAISVPHSNLPISIPDLLEDKHRAKSVILNLAYIAAKDEANPIYWFNENVKEKSQFLSRQVNQHIQLDGLATGDTSVGPVNKARVMSPELISFLNVLTQEANEPIGTGQVLEPKQTGTNTATEAAIDQQMNDLAQSLTSKVMQFGEKEWWSHWFHRYAKHADALESKMANIVGVKGVDSKLIDLKDFNTDYPPGVMVYSAKEAEYKNLVKKRDFMQMLPDLVATMDPDGLRNFQKHVLMPLTIEDPSLIDIMYPKTLDEMKAEGENQQLQEGIMPDVSPMDNHTTHIYTHYMSMPKTWQTWIHLRWHEDELAKQKEQEKQMMMQQGIDKSMSNPQVKPQSGMNKEKRNPMEASTPLKAETKSEINK